MQAFYRGRRLRHSKSLRNFSRETQVLAANLIQPYFVVEGRDQRQTIDAMPDVARLSVDLLTGEVEQTVRAGVPAVLLFGVVDDQSKCEQAKQSYADNGVVQQAIKAIKKEFPDLTVITDVCLCAYTSHGHCGLLNQEGKVDNDSSLPIIAKMALSHVAAGADMVAPSDMMDGRIAAIRQMLDENNYQNTPILSYAAKFASAFYGPFREGSQFGHEVR